MIPCEVCHNLSDRHDTYCPRQAGAFPAPRPGDKCRFIGNHQVEHADDCDQWGKGVVTDARTGRRVRS